MTNGRWWTWIAGQLEAREWSAADLARESSVSEARITEWKNAGMRPSIPSARRVATALGVPLLDVLVAAEHLTPEEARRCDANTPRVCPCTTGEILDELTRRHAESNL
jgi:transcriptional regulator with XRE-family HTH domain